MNFRPNGKDDSELRIFAKKKKMKKKCCWSKLVMKMRDFWNGQNLPLFIENDPKASLGHSLLDHFDLSSTVIIY